MQRIFLKIKRQDNPDGLSYWEEFSVPYDPGMNVISTLMAIGDDPVTVEGLPTTPVVWEQSCLENVCGSCAMIINGRVRLACDTVVDSLDQPIVLEPLSKFPVIRDLKVDRHSMLDLLNKVHAWSDLDGLHDQPSIDRTKEDSKMLSVLSGCIACGACLEGCPQVNDRSLFAGAFVAGQVMLFNRNRSSSSKTGLRLDAMKAPGGVGGCSNAQVCDKVCPKGIPLNDAIARLQWDITRHSIKNFLVTFGG